MKSKFWLALIAIVVLGVGGVTMYFSMIDWNENKHRISNQFSEVTGKRVEFDGPVTFKLFPSPYLSASDVKIYTDNGPDKKLLAKMDSMVASLSLVPLIKGDFEVKRMSLVEPDIEIIVAEDGSVNWDANLSPEQRYAMESIEVTLDSVTLERARLKFVNEASGSEVVLQNMNAEVIASSLLGPYRVEGSYVRDNNMEGFAVSVGRISRGLTTGLNFVINYPKQSTYVRFDGSILPDNQAVNGSVIVESEKIADFINSVLDGAEVGEEYNQPLALSLEVTTNQTRTTLNNVVVKYGSSVGAGNILIPSVEGDKRRKIEASFNMTDLDLNPVMQVVEQVIGKYKTEEYLPNFDADIIFDLKAIKTLYRDQIIRDLAFSADFVDNTLVVKDANAVLPGETNFRANGQVYSRRERMVYDFNALTSTTNFDKFVSWLGYQVDEVAPATYKKADIKFRLEGDLDVLKFSPFEMAFDKTVLKGEWGVAIKKDEPLSFFVSMDVDSINFDNYLRPTPKEIRDEGILKVAEHYLSNVKKLGDADLRAILSSSLVIIEGVPVDRVSLGFDYVNGIMNVSSFSVNEFSNAAIEVFGGISGFKDDDINLDALTYRLQSQDITSLLNRAGVVLEGINVNDYKAVSVQGTISGKLKEPHVQGDASMGNANTIFELTLSPKDELFKYKGILRVKAPDFIKFVNDMGYKYSPNVFSLGLLNFNAEVSGNENRIEARNADIYIGSNNFRGDILFDASGARNNVEVSLEVNKLEVDRFFYNATSVASKEGGPSFRAQVSSERGDFISKPFLDREKIDYGFYTTFDFKGNVKAKDLTCKGMSIKGADLNINLQNAIANVILKGEYKGGVIESNVDWELSSMPTMKGTLRLENQQIDEAVWSGRKYGVIDGSYNLSGKFASNASSNEEMLNSMDADFDFIVQDFRFKGWSLQSIHDDLKVRDRSEGVVTMLKDNLSGGETFVNRMSGKINVTNGAYRFIDTKMVAEKANVKVEAEGSFNLWDMKALFGVSYIDLENVPAFNFSLNGAIISPVLAIEAEQLLGSYDAYWEKIAEERKASLQAKIDNLNVMMDEQQQRAKSLLVRLEGVRKDYEEKKNSATDAEVISAYQNNLDTIDNLSKLAIDVEKYATAVDFEVELVDEIKAKNDSIEAGIKNLSGTVVSLYNKDVKARINECYNKIVSMFKEAQDQIAYYRETFPPYQQRLGNIGSDTNLDDNDNVIQLELNIEEEFLAIDAINTDVKNNFVFIQKAQALPILEDYAAGIKEKSEKAKQSLEDLNKYIANLFEYMEQVVSVEENDYKEKLREEEVKKKVEENIGTISVHGTGKKITVVRDIEEIEKAEEALKKEEVKVLDFSKKTSSVTGKIIKGGKLMNPQETETETLKEGSFLKKIDDDEIETGGTVNRK
ncbi:MAG: AsmA family protein [Lactobacillus sp.]|nr:AsmA family protein [Lactobacillus sp.]